MPEMVTCRSRRLQRNVYSIIIVPSIGFGLKGASQAQQDNKKGMLPFTLISALAQCYKAGSRKWILGKQVDSSRVKA